MLPAILLVLAAWLVWRSLNGLGTGKRKMPGKPVSPRLQQVLDYANRLYSERKFLAAEKGYLELLKLDHKHVLAYTRLGMIYSKQKNYDDAIECFQLAAQFQPNGSSFHNLGLAYFENRNYVKAIAAFEKAIMFEPSAIRYISLAKAYQKVSNQSKTLETLEKAIDLEPSKANLWLLADAYKNSRKSAQAKAIYQRILKLDPEDPKAKRALQLVTA